MDKDLKDMKNRLSVCIFFRRERRRKFRRIGESCVTYSEKKIAQPKLVFDVPPIDSVIVMRSIFVMISDQ